MGKITYRRATGIARPQAVVASTLPVMGGIAYTVGSVFFWPQLYKDNSLGILAASMFVMGSVFYMVAPLLDYLDMTYGIEATKDPPAAEKEVAQLEWLYIQQMMRTQRANTILYFVGAACFVAGSILFYPSMRTEARSRLPYAPVAHPRPSRRPSDRGVAASHDRAAPPPTSP